MVVYLDVVWLLNFLVDFILLALTAIILKRKCKWYRFMLGALIGSSIVVLMFTPLSSISALPITKFVTSFLMIAVTFGFNGFRNFFQALCTLYFATFMVGGGLVGLHYFLQTNTGILEGSVVTLSKGIGDPISWIFVVFAFPLVIYFSKKRVDHIAFTKIHFNQIVKVEIKIENKKWLVKGFIDSGNSLCDPLTGVPVMIIDLSKVKDFVPQWLIEKSKDVRNFDFLSDIEDSTMMMRMRVIPYRAVGDQGSFLIGIRPDSVSVIVGERKIAIKKVLIGLNHTTLSANGEYECILHPKMVGDSHVFSA